jgi:hypothetical protein
VRRDKRNRDIKRNTDLFVKKSPPTVKNIVSAVPSNEKRKVTAPPKVQPKAKTRTPHRNKAKTRVPHLKKAETRKPHREEALSFPTAPEEDSDFCEFLGTVKNSVRRIGHNKVVYTKIVTLSDPIASFRPEFQPPEEID